MSIGLLAGCATVLVTATGAGAAPLPANALSSVTLAAYAAAPAKPPPGAPDPGTAVPPTPVLPNGTVLTPPTGLPAPPPSPPVSPVVNTVQTQQAAVEGMSERLTQLKQDLGDQMAKVTTADQAWTAASTAYRQILQSKQNQPQTSFLSVMGAPTSGDTNKPQSDSATNLSAAAAAVVQTAQDYAQAFQQASALQTQQADLQKQFDTQSAALKILQAQYGPQLAAANSAIDAFNNNLSSQYGLIGPGGAASPIALKALAFALAQRGKPYVFGASGTNSYDCSSLVQESYRYAGIRLPRTARPQWRTTRPVQVNALLPGDLLFFGPDKSNWDSIHHVGIYLGNGKMVHAPQPGDVVKIAPIWWAEYFGATRVVGAVPPGQSGPVPTIPGGGGGTGGGGGGGTGGGGSTKPPTNPTKPPTKPTTPGTTPNSPVPPVSFPPPGSPSPSDPPPTSGPPASPSDSTESPSASPKSSE